MNFKNPIIISIFLFMILSISPIFANTVNLEQIKTIANLWADGLISDRDFSKIIPYLISDRIITIEGVNYNHVGLVEIQDEIEIPTWIKNNAKWWHEGMISDIEFLNGFEFLLQENVITSAFVTEFDKSRSPDDYLEVEHPNSLFRTFVLKQNFIIVDGDAELISPEFELNSEYEKIYQEISVFEDSQSTVVIIPTFTLSAYSEHGFYDYYNDKCDQSCLTTPIITSPLNFESSNNAVGVLELLGYNFTTDVDVDKNPELLLSYDKVIVLHSEYVTQKMYDAITSHPKVIFLYPNALYAKINVDYDENTITLVRGHGYPKSEIINGFNWEFENTHPFEFDIMCENWEFYEINNGVMLNCYPENLILQNEIFLKKIKDL